MVRLRASSRDRSRSLGYFVWPNQSSLAIQDQKPTPPTVKKKKGKKGKKVRQVKVVGTRLEDFIDWANPIPPTRETQGVRHVSHIASESVEESEDDMSSLDTGFVARMRKRATSAQGETTPGFEVLGEKRSKWSGLDEKVHNSPTIVSLDSLERVFDAFPTLEGVAQDASREACASFKDGIPTGGPLSPDKVLGEAPSAETVVSPLLSDRQSGLIIVGLLRPGVLISWC